MGRLLTVYLELQKDTLQIPKRILLSTLRLGTKGRILRDRLNKSVSETASQLYVVIGDGWITQIRRWSK